MARSGMEIMIGSMIKALGLDPQVILGKVEEIRNMVHYAGASVEEIKAHQETIIIQQRAIMAHLGVQDAGTEEHGRREHASRRIADS